jgi:hypothetical protein
MEIFIWLLVAILVLAPGKNAGRDSGGDRLRSLTLLLGLIYLITQVSGV